MGFSEIFDRPWSNALEILILSFLTYGVYLLLRATRGVLHLAVIVFILLGLALTAQYLQLEVLQLLTRSFLLFALMVVVIIFAPELRRAVAEVNRYQFFSLNSSTSETLEVVCDAVEELSRRHFGALIAIRRRDSLSGLSEKGVKLDAVATKELLLTIFFPKTALHDGGVILKGERIAAAACVFPVTPREMKDRSLGLRHRAGLGMSEETDAIVVVVSEETGQISICVDGNLERDLDGKELRTRLLELSGRDEDDDDDDEAKSA